MTWSATTGTLSATVGTESTLASPTTNGVYVLLCDLVNLAIGEIVECRLYDKVDGTNYAQIAKAAFQGGLTIGTGILAFPFPVTTQAKFTLKQLNGTGRSIPWSLRSQ
jgi:hypothetical protein